MKNKFGRFSWILYGITLPHAHYKYSTTTTWYSVAATFGKSYIEMIKGCQNVNYVLRLQNTKAYTVGFAFEMCSICHIKPYECGSFPHKKVTIFAPRFPSLDVCSNAWSLTFEVLVFSIHTAHHSYCLIERSKWHELLLTWSWCVLWWK